MLKIHNEVTTLFCEVYEVVKHIFFHFFQCRKRQKKKKNPVTKCIEIQKYFTFSSEFNFTVESNSKIINKRKVNRE